MDDLVVWVRFLGGEERSFLRHSVQTISEVDSASLPISMDDTFSGGKVDMA
jgi:hypothetical protein